MTDLDILLGSWVITGRTLKSDQDDISDTLQISQKLYERELENPRLSAQPLKQRSRRRTAREEQRDDRLHRRRHSRDVAGLPTRRSAPGA